VEGNTTFYRIPTAELVAKWRDTVSQTDFRFCFKLPRSVTHDRRPDFDALTQLLRAIEPLGDHIGPLLVQFPGRTGPHDLDRIEAVLKRLPRYFPCALEVRHPRFFDQSHSLDRLLERFGCARVAMDTRALYRGDPGHHEVSAARHEKPDLPVPDAVHNDLRFLRLVLHPSDDTNEEVLTEWAGRIAEDLEAGRRVFAFIHCPNNLHCPKFAQRFHRYLRTKTFHPIAALPPWPSGLK
jgi:uncharacterized protein YecE (DUF72 family)